MCKSSISVTTCNSWHPRLSPPRQQAWVLCKCKTPYTLHTKFLKLSLEVIFHGPDFFMPCPSTRLYFQGCLCTEKPWKIEIVSSCGAKGRFDYALEKWIQYLPPEKRAYLLTGQISKDNVFPEQRAGILLLFIEDLSFLNSEFICCNGTHYMHRLHLSLFASPNENWVWRTSTKMLILRLLWWLWVLNCLLSLTQGSYTLYQHPKIWGRLICCFARRITVLPPSHF